MSSGGSGSSGTGGPGDIWAPFRRKNSSVPTPMEWIRDWAQGRPNPIRHLSRAKLFWERGRDAFEQARDESHTEIGRTMRREAAREEISFGAGRAVHFDPARLEGPRLRLPARFRRPRRLDIDEPASETPPVGPERRPSPRPGVAYGFTTNEFGSISSFATSSI